MNNIRQHLDRKTFDRIISESTSSDVKYATFSELTELYNSFVKLLEAVNEGIPRCPQCNLQLEEVSQSASSLLNEYQWETIKAGDYYCINCPPDKNMRYKYFWKKELK